MYTNGLVTCSVSCPVLGLVNPAQHKPCHAKV